MYGKKTDFSGIVIRAAWTVVLGLLVTMYAAAQGRSQEGASMSIQLTSSAFAPETPIPVKFSCRGDDISPPLSWTDVPDGTKSFALIVDDPDAPMGTWVHWVYFNIPAATRSLSEAVHAGYRLADGSNQGIGSSGDNRFHGPCPPSGRHRYFFKIYALDATLSLPASTDKQTLLASMKGHVLAEGQLMGYFSK